MIFPNESQEYRDARDALLRQEVELMRHSRPSRRSGNPSHPVARFPKTTSSTASETTAPAHHLDILACASQGRRERDTVPSFGHLWQK
jgi:hypothetical protein